MTERNDGGTAFPIPLLPGESHEQHAGGANGMSLRDYFAAQALSGLLCRSGYDPSGAAEDAYKMADAMIAGRRE